MSNTHTTLPRDDGFSMPAENTKQQQVLMAWPERADNWRLNARPAQAQFAAIATAIAEVTPVTMFASPQQAALAREQLPSHITVIEMATDDCWMRDIGPSYVQNHAGEIRGVDWPFNAWGGELDGLYAPWDSDDKAAQTILSLRGEDRYRAPLILEGGAIHIDGDGTLYTTEECLLHPSRNPHLDRQDIEQHLRNYLNVEKVIWLKRGLFNDETNGHVDNLMHLVKPGEVLLSWCDDAQDPMFAICRENLAILDAATDAQGRAIVVHKMPIPGPLYMSEEEASGIAPSNGMSRESGERLGGSYVNFLITNGRVVFPLLDPNNDHNAQQILERCFPDYDIVGVPAREVLLGGGNIHCITQQVPATQR
ncbi:MAG: agmatine deiminase [Cellvibrionaceae bacterium]